MIFQMEPNSGLDIGTRTVKGVVLKKRGDKMVLTNCFLLDLAKGRGFLPTGEDALTIAGAAVEANNWRNSWVGSLFEDKELITFELTIPKIPEEEIRAAVENELEQKLTFPIEDAVIDFSVSAVNEQSLLVRIFCVKKSFVEKKISLLKSYKLLPDLLLPEAMANLEMLKFNGYLDAPGFYINIDCGESHTTTSLIHNGDLVLSNALWTGSGLVNQKLVDACKVSYEEADSLKVNHNFDEQKSTDVAQCIDDGFSEILIGVHKSIDYYKIRTKGSTIQNILLTGGGSSKTGLDSIIAENFKIPTIVANPLKNIEIFSAKVSPVYIDEISSHLGAAIGLALRGAA